MPNMNSHNITVMISGITIDKPRNIRFLDQLGIPEVIRIMQLPIMASDGR
jgi:phosphoenolpyruvate synthase/pyruvate phosphate dikinase